MIQRQDKVNEGLAATEQDRKKGMSVKKVQMHLRLCLILGVKSRENTCYTVGCLTF